MFRGQREKNEFLSIMGAIQQDLQSDIRKKTSTLNEDKHSEKEETGKTVARYDFDSMYLVQELFSGKDHARTQCLYIKMFATQHPWVFETQKGKDLVVFSKPDLKKSPPQLKQDYMFMQILLYICSQHEVLQPLAESVTDAMRQYTYIGFEPDPKHVVRNEYEALCQSGWGTDEEISVKIAKLEKYLDNQNQINSKTEKATVYSILGLLHKSVSRQQLSKLYDNADACLLIRSLIADYGYQVIKQKSIKAAYEDFICLMNFLQIAPKDEVYEPSITNFYSTYINENGSDAIVEASQWIAVNQADQYPHDKGFYLYQFVLSSLSIRNIDAILTVKTLDLIQESIENLAAGFDESKDNWWVFYVNVIVGVYSKHHLWRELKQFLQSAFTILEKNAKCSDILALEIEIENLSDIKVYEREMALECLTMVHSAVCNGPYLNVIKGLRKIYHLLRQDAEQRKLREEKAAENALLEMEKNKIADEENKKKQITNLMDSFKKKHNDTLELDDQIDNVLKSYHILRSKEREKQREEIAGFKKNLETIRSKISACESDLSLFSEGEMKFSYDVIASQFDEINRSIKRIFDALFKHETALKRSIEKVNTEVKSDLYAGKAKQAGSKKEEKSKPSTTPSLLKKLKVKKEKNNPEAKTVSQPLVAVAKPIVYSDPSKRFIHGAYQSLLNMNLLLSPAMAEFNPEIRHFVLIYNILRCFHGLRTYMERGGHTHKMVDLQFDDLSTFRNMLRHCSLSGINRQDVLDTANKLCESLPEIFRAMCRPNEMTRALSSKQLKEIDDLFDQYEEKENGLQPSIVNSLPLTSSLMKFHEAKITTKIPQATIDAELNNFYLPAIKRILSDIHVSADDNKKNFSLKYHFHLQALSILLSSCAEFKRHNTAPKFKDFLKFTVNIGWRVGHVFPEDFKIIDIYSGATRALEDVAWMERSESREIKPSFKNE